MTTRRHFLSGACLGAAAVSSASLAGLPEAAQPSSAATQVPPTPHEGLPYHPVVTLNSWSLPWRLNQGWKEFHLVAEPVLREFAPGMTAQLWGYNGSSPGPTIEVVEGDKVRIFVTNRLPEPTAMHWHGQRLPNGMDGVAGLTQPAIAPGKTFVYEFEARRPGSFMYHPHADEMVQMAMGMMGLWITHPRQPKATPHYQPVDRDFAFIMNAFNIEPGSRAPQVMTMLDFNLWAWNSRVFPGIDPLVVRKGDRVRIRVGNLTMTNHPLHLHGHEFQVTGTDGGFVPTSARWPEVTTDIAVGQMRAIEFIASEVGDWSLHCHKSHHTMNAMGHNLPTLIGADLSDVADKVQALIPGYMPMGERGMHDMATMQMPLPANTLPMMTGQGLHGPIGMGGMFTTVKVREGLAAGDYRDPGWYRSPAATQAKEWAGELPPAPQASPTRSPASQATPSSFKARKLDHGGHKP